MKGDTAKAHAATGWGGGELVVCVDGPRDGAWYTAKFWTQARESAIAMGETPHSGRTLGYVRTNEKEPHRLNDQVHGHILAWAPDVAAKAAGRTA